MSNPAEPDRGISNVPCHPAFLSWAGSGSSSKLNYSHLGAKHLAKSQQILWTEQNLPDPGFVSLSLGERQGFSSKGWIELIKRKKIGVGAGSGEILQRVLNLKEKHQFRRKGLLRAGGGKGWLGYKVFVFLDSLATIAMLGLAQGIPIVNRNRTSAADVQVRASVCVTHGCFSSVLRIVKLVHQEIFLICENIWKANLLV